MTTTAQALRIGEGTAESAVNIDLVPVSPSWWPQMWAWLMEDSDANADDYGAQSEAEYCAQRAVLLKLERIWGVMADGQRVGFIQYVAASPMLGSLHICLTCAVHRHGVATEALRRVRDELVAEGVSKLTIAVFADNEPVIRLCRKFGAVDEGLCVKHTRTNGRLRDVKLMAIFAD